MSDNDIITQHMMSQYNMEGDGTWLHETNMSSTDANATLHVYMYTHTCSGEVKAVNTRTAEMKKHALRQATSIGGSCAWWSVYRAHLSGMPRRLTLL